jgi:hypothetical protein
VNLPTRNYFNPAHREAFERAMTAIQRRLGHKNGILLWPTNSPTRLTLMAVRS